MSPIILGRTDLLDMSWNGVALTSDAYSLHSSSGNGEKHVIIGEYKLLIGEPFIRHAKGKKL